MRGKRLHVLPNSSISTAINPPALRKLVFDLVQHDFDGSFRQAAVAINKTSLTSGVSQHKKLSQFTLYDIVVDRVALKYSHLNLIARYLNIPTGILLLYTHAYANCRNCTQEDGLVDNDSIVSQAVSVIDAIHSGTVDFSLIDLLADREA